jgi:hypothetical protein
MGLTNKHNLGVPPCWGVNQQNMGEFGHDEYMESYVGRQLIGEWVLWELNSYFAIFRMGIFRLTNEMI